MALFRWLNESSEAYVLNVSKPGRRKLIFSMPFRPVDFENEAESIQREPIRLATHNWIRCALQQKHHDWGPKPAFPRLLVWQLWQPFLLGKQRKKRERHPSPTIMVLTWMDKLSLYSSASFPLESNTIHLRNNHFVMVLLPLLSITCGVSLGFSSISTPFMHHHHPQLCMSM